MIPRSVVIVGAGLAGSRVAETLRAEGYYGRVVLTGEEKHAPYERPALSKEYLAGERPSVALRAEEFWTEREIELVLGMRVESIDLLHKAVAHGIPWDAIVIATGARARRPPFDVPSACTRSGPCRTRRRCARLCIRLRRAAVRRRAVLLVGSVRPPPPARGPRGGMAFGRDRRRPGRLHRPLRRRRRKAARCSPREPPAGGGDVPPCARGRGSTGSLMTPRELGEPAALSRLPGNPTCRPSWNASRYVDAAGSARCRSAPRRASRNDGETA